MPDMAATMAERVYCMMSGDIVGHNQEVIVQYYISPMLAGGRLLIAHHVKAQYAVMGGSLAPLSTLPMILNI